MSTQLPTYANYLVGEYVLTTSILFEGTIQTVSIEQFADGYLFIVNKADGKYSNRRRYTTALGAVKAAERAGSR